MYNFSISVAKKYLFTLLIPITLIGGSLIACSETKDTQTLIAEAKQYQQEGDEKAAVIQLKNALKQSPDNAEARFILGSLYIQSGDSLSAEKELNKALSLGMDSNKVLPLLGKALFRLGEFQQLLDKTKSLSETSNTPEISILRADAFMALGQHQEAKIILDLILKETPDAPYALISLAKYSLSQKDIESASQYIEQAVTKNPENADAWLFKADLLRAQNKNDEALVAFNQSIKLKPDNILPYISRATIEISKREFDAAKLSIEAAHKIAPGAIIINYTQALLDFSQGKNAEAYESLQQVLSFAPEHMPSTLLAGAVQFALGSNLQAEQYLTNYLEKIPGNLYARKLMISILLKNGRTQEAIEILTPTLNAVKEDPQLLALAGEVYMKAKDYTKATWNFEQASKLAPKNAKLHTALGMSKLAMGNKDQGIAELVLATNLDANSSRAGVLLALTHLRLKEFDKALSAAEALEKTEPNNPVFQNLKGGIYLNKQDYANARTSFNKALSLKPDYFPAIQNLAKLDLHDKKPDAAKKRFEAILKNDENNIQAMNALASLALAQGNTQETTAWLEKASSKNPDAQSPAINLVTHYLRINEKKKSLMLAQKLFGTNSTEPRVLEVLGKAQLANDQKENALASYEKLATYLPDSAPLQLRIAAIHNAMNNQSATSTALKKALRLQPNYLDAQVTQVQFLASNKLSNEALHLSQKIQKQHPKSPAGFVLAGDILTKQKKPELAIKAYEQALSIVQNGQLMIKIHAALSQAGKNKEANSRLIKWLDKTPNDDATRLYFASSYLDKQQYDAAIGQYQTILKKYPDHTITLNNLAWLYQQKENPKLALEYAEKAYKQAPKSPVIMDTLGWVLVGQGNIKRALPLLQKASLLAPNATEIQYHYAFGLAKSGDKSKARKVLEQLLASGEAFPKINEVKALLAQTQ